MNICRTGIILNTERYAECVAFYRDLFRLKVLFEEDSGDSQLTCFEYGGAYLMVEMGGYANPQGKSKRESATKLRFNVTDIDEALQTVRAWGIDAEILESEWGRTINIFDPDGNRIGIRDEATFKSQFES